MPGSDPGSMGLDHPESWFVVALVILDPRFEPVMTNGIACCSVRPTLGCTRLVSKAPRQCSTTLDHAGPRYLCKLVSVCTVKE